MIAPIRPVEPTERDGASRRKQLRRARRWVVKNFLTSAASDAAPRPTRRRAELVCAWMLVVVGAWCWVMFRAYVPGR